jgi:predicted RNA-binding Zn-ribbon protein involved in translation (DUF1610 family)
MASTTNADAGDCRSFDKRTKVICPKCGGISAPRYAYKKQNVEYVCPECKEVYHPAKFI